MKNCRICLFIRYFIVSVIFIVVISIIFMDDLSYFAFVTPWNVVKIIFFLDLYYSFLSYLNITKKIKISVLLKTLYKVFFLEQIYQMYDP